MMSVREREQADLGAVQVLLYEDAAAAGCVPDRGVPVVGDDDPLAGRQAVVLHHIRRPELVEGGHHVVHAEADPGIGSGHAGGLHDLLGERLAALEPGGLGAGAEDRNPGRPDVVCHPGHEGRLRPDHHQVGGESTGQRGDRFTVEGVDGVVRPDP